NDGEQAVAAVQRERFDVVLMDVAMPVMNGYEATAAIGRLPQFGMRIPIVAMTANAFSEDRSRCIDAGMADYVSKPISLEAIVEAIGRVMSSDGTSERRRVDVVA